MDVNTNMNMNMKAGQDPFSSFIKSNFTRSESFKVLFYGIGNIGRQDDGLGVYLIENLEKLSPAANVSLQANYQLNIEDALEISEYDIVVFVDSTKEKDLKSPFQFREINPSMDISFTTHAMTMESILALCEQVYLKTPKAFVLSIPGCHWEILDQLSDEGKRNLQETLNYLQNIKPLFN